MVAIVVIGGLLVFGAGLWLGRARADETASRGGWPPAVPTNPTVSPSRPIQYIKHLNQLPPGKVEHVDAVYFHVTQRCEPCIKTEWLIRETLSAYFADRLKSGVMNLVVADFQQPQNAALTRKYEASSSSLYLGILKSGVEYILPVNDVWHLLLNEAKFMAALRDKINLVYGCD